MVVRWLRHDALGQSRKASFDAPLSNRNEQSVVTRTRTTELLRRQQYVGRRYRTLGGGLISEGRRFLDTRTIPLGLFQRVSLLPKLETLWRDTAFGGFLPNGSVGDWGRACRLLRDPALCWHRCHWSLLSSHYWSGAASMCRGIAGRPWAPRLFLANTTILIFITTMFMTALMAAPALPERGDASAA